MRGFCKWCNMEVQVNPDGTCFLGHPARVVKVSDAPLENDRVSERMVGTEVYEPAARATESGQGQVDVAHVGVRAAPVELATLAAMTPSLRSQAPFEACPIPYTPQDPPVSAKGDPNWEAVATSVGPQVFRYGGPVTEPIPVDPEQSDVGGRHERIGMLDDAGIPTGMSTEARHDVSRGGMSHRRVLVLLALAALVALVAIYILISLL